MDTATTIGGRKVIGAHALLIPEGEKAQSTFPFAGSEVAVGFEFRHNPDVKAGQVAFEFDGKIVQFVLTNWVSQFGETLAKPLAIGRIGDGEFAGVMLSHRLIGARGNGVHELTVLFMVGGKDYDAANITED
jgi:hypothetical protein